MWKSIIENNALIAFLLSVVCGLIAIYCYKVVKKDEYAYLHIFAGVIYCTLSFCFFVCGVLEL